MRVIVTGASGLIGYHTCNLLLRAGHEVLGTDIRPRPEGAADWNFEVCDLLDRSALTALLTRFEPTHVLHLAARTDLEGKTLADYAVNIDGVKNLISAIRCVTGVTRAVFTSSQLVCQVGHVPTSDEEYQPSTVYGESKVEGERLVRATMDGGTSWCIVRPTTVWGPGMSDHYRSLFHYIEKGFYFHSGSGPLYKTYSYVGNIAYQYMRLLEADSAAVAGKVFYMADYLPISLRDYVNAIARELGARRLVTVPLPVARLLALVGDMINALGINFPYNSFLLHNIRTEYIFDMSRTSEVCGPLPYDFETGVRETVAWFKGSHGKPGRRPTQ